MRAHAIPGFDRNCIHPREIDYDAVVAESPPGDVMAAALDRHEKIIPACQFHGCHDISRVRTPGNQPWPCVDAGIPDLPRLIVAVVAGLQRLAMKSAFKFLDYLLAYEGAVPLLECTVLHSSLHA
jgi:hypothetical protein